MFDSQREMFSPPRPDRLYGSEPEDDHSHLSGTEDENLSAKCPPPFPTSSWRSAYAET
jgi:hypothetical protein